MISTLIIYKGSVSLYIEYIKDIHTGMVREKILQYNTHHFFIIFNFTT